MSIEQFDFVLLVGIGVVLSAIVAVRLSTRTGLPSLLLCTPRTRAAARRGRHRHLLQRRCVGTGARARCARPHLGRGRAHDQLEARPTRDPRRRCPGHHRCPGERAGDGAGGLQLLGCLLAGRRPRGSNRVVDGFGGRVLGAAHAAAATATSGILEAESGFNDAPVVILVIALSEPPSDVPGVLPLLGLLVMELVGGAALGLGIGWLGAQGLRRVALPASGSTRWRCSHWPWGHMQLRPHCT